MAAASATPTEYVQHKAQRLLRDGRVTDHGREDFTVIGDHGTYSVLLPARRLDRGGLCSCPAWRACSHIHACKLLLAERIELRLDA
jgi:uncharacterized Zn finger protein